MTNQVQAKKRHHFVPIAYLQAFKNKAGRILVYRKDDPTVALPVKPAATAFENYYYSQPTQDGSPDHNRLEDVFCKLEGTWPPIVRALQAREDVNAHLESIFQFILLQRVRVPASRDATEARLAAQVRQLMATMHANGQLPPMPPELEGKLDDVIVSIDPHKSIHGMVDDIQAAHDVFDRIGLCVVHNRTSVPFLTSDNPVMWSDPTLQLEKQEPYRVQPGGPVQLVFPVSPTMVLLGKTELKQQFGTHGLQYGEVSDEDWVLRVNLDVCRYAYAAVYATAEGSEDLIRAFASESPVWQDDGDSGRLTFGTRTAKPKWHRRDDDI